MYRDLGDTIDFSIFTMQIFPPSQKITITKYNAVSYPETEKLFFLLLLKTISICQAVTNRIRAFVTYSNHKFYKLPYLIVFKQVHLQTQLFSFLSTKAILKN